MDVEMAMTYAPPGLNADLDCESERNRIASTPSRSGRPASMIRSSRLVHILGPPLYNQYGRFFFVRNSDPAS